MQVGIGVSAQQDYIKAVREAVEKAKAGISSPKTDFALIFTTEEFNHPLVLQTIKSLIGPIPLIGACSKAVISNTGPLKQGLAVILFSLNDGVYFNAACIKDIASKNAVTAGEELGEKLLYGCKDVRRNLSIIFSNTGTAADPSLINGLQEKLGRGFPLMGTSSPASIEHKENSLYFDSQILNDAACGILWGGKVNFNLGVEHGWQALGKPRYITKASIDTVNQIDGAAAVNLYKEYFAKEAFELEKDLERLSVFYPLGISASEKKEYLLRSIVAIKNDGSLVFRSDVPETSSVRLMISSKESCLASARRAAEKAMIGLKNKKIKMGLIFSSASRLKLLGRQAPQEIKIVRDVLGEDTPLAGIYTYTEIAPLSSLNYYSGKTYFHNNSITVLTITE